MSRIYLAGSFKPWNTFADWREFVIDNVTNHEFIDPKSHTSQQSIATLVTGDFKGIAECDMLLAFTMKGSQPSPGMSAEMGSAYTLKKPIIYVEENQIPYPPLLGMAKRFFTTLDAAVCYLQILKSTDEKEEFKAIYQAMKECNPRV